MGFISITGAKTFLFIGDSITDGNWGSPQKYPCSSSERNLWDKNHILGHGFVEMIAGYYMGEFPASNYNFINRGISGETLGQIARRWDEDCLDHSPAVVSLLCGTNDVHYWLEGNPESLEEFNFHKFTSTLDSLVKITQTRLPDSEIVLCTPFVSQSGIVGRSDNYYLRKAAVDSLAAIIRQTVDSHPEKKIILVDFNRLSQRLNKEKETPEYWIWDGIHPTTAMHHRMAKEWIEIMNK